MKSKVTKTSAPPFMKGGNGTRAGKQSAGPQKSGTSAQVGSGGGKFAKGGGGKMFGKQSASPMPSGKSGK